ncbi:alpha/beta fold hydrolase [Streptomyces variegatus]|uniref:alpha/beta fold hydrolase n=1 Tax=Streptomyces variegatus TaxID=284040 RepID=UPI003C2C3470
MQVTGGDGVEIALETVGSGLPLVLLHGFFGDRTTWRSGYVDALADSHRLVLIDGRGHGGSDAPHDVDSYRIDRQVEDVTAVLDELGLVGGHFLQDHPRHSDPVVPRLTQLPDDVRTRSFGRQKVHGVRIKDDH